MIARHGTQEQKNYFLPRMAAGEVRGSFSMSEPGLGSDVSAIRTRAVQMKGDEEAGGDYVINGQKMWLTNGATSNLVALLCRTDDGHDAPHRNMTTLLIEKEPGFGPNPAVPGLTVPGKIEKMGYKGVDTTELILEDVRVPASRVLGGRTGQGFYQMMDGVEVGRVNVAARGCGVALRAFELAIDYAQRRHAFGKPISQHQAIQFKLAEMATKVEAAHQMMVMAARRKDSGHRNDLEAGMAKYLASITFFQVRSAPHACTRCHRGDGRCTRLRGNPGRRPHRDRHAPGRGAPVTTQAEGYSGLYARDLGPYPRTGELPTVEVKHGPFRMKLAPVANVRSHRDKPGQ